MLPGGTDQSWDTAATADEVATALISEIAPVVVGVVDLEERLVQIGGALLPRLGHRPDDWVGRSLADMVDDPTARRLVRDGLSGGAGTDNMILNGRRWLMAVRPVRSATGVLTGAVAVLTFADEGDMQLALTTQESLKEQFVALVEMSKDFIAIADPEGDVTFVNRAGRELVGLHTDEETLGRPLHDFSPEQDRAQAQEIVRSVRSLGSWEGETTVQHVETGESIPVSVSAFQVNRSSDGRPLALAAVLRDLRARKSIESALAVRVQEQRAIAELGRLALTLPLTDLMDEAVQLITARYPTLVAGVLHRLPNGTQSQLVASSLEEARSVVVALDEGSLTGRAMSQNTLLYTDDIVTDDRFDRRQPTTRLGMRSVLCCPIPQGEHPWGAVGAASRDPHHWTDDDLAFVESVAATLGAAVRRDDLENRLKHQALHDPLTGLPNRTLVQDRVESALRRSARRGSLVAVLLLDVDDFKAVNDTLGHSAGDQLLSALALRMEAVVREGDTVGRLGGDEFVVVCEDLASSEDVAFVAEALIEACATGVELGDRRLPLSVSIGAALTVAGAASTSSMLSEADIAMYRAKHDRPGTYRIFDEAMRGDVLGRITVAGELRAAVRAEQLDIAYQPILDLATGRVVAMEALARWTNEAGESVPPDVFIPVAESTGIIGELGALILRGAAQEAATWQDLGAVGVRVNASAHELRSRHFVEQVLSTLDRSGLTTDLLGLEITESAFIDDDATTQDNLSRLSDAGVSLLIDDFGTGYSSLSYLQRFPVVDVLKVDRSFLGEGTRGEAVIQTVIGLGRAFGLLVCAEGVETPEQLARVTELGCDYAQGYLLSRPVPAAQARDLLAAWKPVTSPIG